MSEGVERKKTRMTGNRATDSAWEKHGSADVPEQRGKGRVKIREWETWNQLTLIHGP